MCKLRLVLPTALVAILLIGSPPPTAAPADEDARDVAASSQAIDKLLAGLAKDQKVLLSPPAGDLEWLRRVTLDLIARLPTEVEIRAFEGATGPDKRTRRVDDLVASDEFSEYWGNLWARELLERHFKTSNWISRERWIGYVISVFRANKPYQQMVREMIEAEGDARDIGATNFVLSCDGDAAEIAGTLTRQLLGISMQCAQCHDHPYEKWKQKDFWGVAAYFARAKTETYMVKDATYYVLKESKDGELEIPRREGLRVQPNFPVAGVPNKLSDKGNRRQTLAAILLLPENARLAEVAVNRVWRHFFGAGFVEPQDGFGEKPMTKFAAPLRRLAEDFARHRFDLKRLIRVVVLSETYARSSVTDRPGEDPTAFERARVRRLNDFQRFAALLQATGYRKAVLGWNGGDEAKAGETIAWLRQRFVDIPDERSRTTMYFNGEMVRHAVEGGPVIPGMIEEGLEYAPALDRLFLATLSRHPTMAETERLSRRLDEADDLAAAYKGVFWGLLNSLEFQTNH